MLVSYGYSNKKLVMLNLYKSEDETILFEMNKLNIYQQKLVIDDEILAVGGSEIDVLDMYLKSQESLRQMEQREAKLRSDVIKEREEVARLANTIKIEQGKLTLQTETIENQRTELLFLADRTSILNNDILDQKELFLAEQKKIKPLADSLTQLKIDVLERADRLLQSQYLLDTLEKKIADVRGQISNKDIQLVEKDSTINQQQQVVYAISALVMLALIMTIVVVYALLKNRAKNKRLSDHKVVISDKNATLERTIGELKSTQNQLLQSEKMASLGVLTAGIAHEINNPVNFVYVGATNLKREFEDLDVILKEVNQLEILKGAEAAAWVEKIIDLKGKHDYSEIYELLPNIIDSVGIGADRIAEIVKGLRNFSRMDLDSYSDADVHKMIDGTLILLKNEYKDKIEIITSYDKSLPVIECNFGKISQVILNILINAVHAIPDKGKIEITTSYTKTSVNLSFEDSGKGMDNQVLENIFDPFFTTKDVGEGTGLGLSISYGIVKEHGGDIKVNSVVGKGTEFIVNLPIDKTIPE
jgi:signal transduction histidine kinase